MFFHYAACHILYIIMLNAVMLSVVTVNVVVPKYCHLTDDQDCCNILPCSTVSTGSAAFAGTFAGSVAGAIANRTVKHN